MRIWTLHPQYLDRQGLIALWREALLAQAVLLGKTVGYRHHPQLIRFQRQKDPVAAISSYLWEVHREAGRRGYHFDGDKIEKPRGRCRIGETSGQLAYEWRHLKKKLSVRSPATLTELEAVIEPRPHPFFRIVAGEVREWEIRRGDPAEDDRSPKWNHLE